ncbi:hypothetical protein RSOLAG1IB_05344 [Rhizoctonia solani AG-1 IB]|uniref:Uncharacterized protein n=1 Tax=Thanatephorus cucumeris (strain AG1-IB / isolate 7/3/14) TaxID=1108050 RepID=M5C6Q9_THACB|nr:hypothetical protein BN14_09726 [Rhizoctonia solani AG-1 IB]CEL63301.1 hypothetical protein RSOLAG1IB_05344 [Rhizoctonia solani AG-1 IB]
MHDFKSPGGVLAYLKGTRFVATYVQLLSGGNSAFTYRVLLESPLETGEASIVIKHFEGYLSGHESVKWDVQRADHEYKALSAIATSGLFDSDSTVQLPVPLEYDQETHTIFMTDLGSPLPITQVLEQGFSGEFLDSSGSSEFDQVRELAQTIGWALGDFVGRFHNWSALPEQSELRAYFSLNPSVIQQCVYIHHLCLNLAADRFQMRETWMDELIAKEQQEALAGGDVLVMGDCSLHNLLVSPPSANCGMRIYLTDLEMTRASYPELDVGELTATVLSFTRLCSSSAENPLITALHQAYRRHRSLDSRRMAIATGTDLMGLGTVLPWATNQNETKLRELAVAGLELLKSSVKGDESFIKTNPVLRHLFLPQSQQIL